MNKVLATFLGAALFVGAAIANVTPAFAETVTGTITEVDGDNGTVTLDDGTIYIVGDVIDLTALEAGTKVEIDFDKDGDDNIVNELAIVE